MKCAVCGSNMIPPGISKKTGESYNAFCSNAECSTRQRKPKQFQKSPRPLPPSHANCYCEKCWEELRQIRRILDAGNKQIDETTLSENGLVDDDWGKTEDVFGKDETSNL